MKYNRNDKVTDFHRACLLNEGRAKNLDSDIYKKREPHVDKLEYEFSKTGGIDFYSGELYLNAIGDVMDKKWLENIRSSKLCIEENS